MRSFKNYLKGKWDLFLEKIFVNIFSDDDRDPFEDMLVEQGAWKPWFFLFLIFPLVYYSETRPFIGLWFLGGSFLIWLRIKITAYVEKDLHIFGRELLCALKSGDLTSELFILWPFDLLITLLLLLFGKYRNSFSEDYRRLRFKAYRSGGKYWGMHLDTAIEWSEGDVITAAHESDEVVAAVKKKSFLMVVYGSMVSFLITPFNYLRGNTINNGALKYQVTQPVVPLPNGQPILAAVFTEIARMLKRSFAIIALIIILIIVFHLNLRHWFLPPIRYIPITNRALSSANQINAPPHIVVDFNYLTTNLFSEVYCEKDNNYSFFSNLFVWSASADKDTKVVCRSIL